MKLLLTALFAACGLSAYATELSSKNILDIAAHSDAIVVIDLTPAKVRIFSVWKPDDNVSEKTPIKNGINHFLLDHPAFNPPKDEQLVLLFLRYPGQRQVDPLFASADYFYAPIRQKSLMLKDDMLYLPEFRSAINRLIQKHKY